LELTDGVFRNSAVRPRSMTIGDRKFFIT
jgi:hypothetical protein